MNDELPDEPKEQKPESQAFCGKSVSASTPNNNEALDRTSLTPIRKPDNNIPYVLSNKTLSPISNDVTATSATTAPTSITTSTTNDEKTRLNSRGSYRTSLPPLRHLPQTPKPELADKKSYTIIIAAISILIITSIGLLLASLLSSNNDLFSNLTNSSSPQRYPYQNIGAKCPAIKNNIQKIETDPNSDRNLILTKNGDLYLFIGINNTETSSYPTGDCYKLDKASNVKDIKNQKNTSVFQYKNGTAVDSLYYPESKKYRLVILGESPQTDFAFSYLTAKSPNTTKLNIDRYFYQSNHDRLFLIDTKNNVYDDKFNKLIDGSIFDSEIKPISSVQEMKDVIYIASKKYVYAFNIDYKSDTQTKATLVKQDATLFGTKANDIAQIVSTTDPLQSYIITNDGNIYQTQNVKLTNNTRMPSSENQTIIYLAIGLYAAFLLLIIAFSYSGENKSYASGLQKTLILIVTICVALAIYGFANNKTDNITAFNTLNAVIYGFIYFTSYFITKRIIWFLMHKANIRSKVIFAVLYILFYIVTAQITFLFFSGLKTILLP